MKRFASNILGIASVILSFVTAILWAKDHDSFENFSNSKFAFGPPAFIWASAVLATSSFTTARGLIWLGFKYPGLGSDRPSRNFSAKLAASTFLRTGAIATAGSGFTFDSNARMTNARIMHETGFIAVTAPGLVEHAGGCITPSRKR